MQSELRILDFNYLFQRATDLIPSTEDPSFPASNLKNQLRANTWRTTSTTAQSVVIDLRTSEAVDMVVLVFDPMVGIGFTNSAVIKIQANATNVWTSPAYEQSLVIDEDNGIASLFLSSDQTYRYWRLYISDPGNALGYLEVSKLLLGKATQLLQMPNIGFAYNTKDQSKSQKTEYGHEYVDIYPNRKAIDFNYTVITQEDMETLANIYERVGSVRCVGVALDPTETLFDKDRFFVYGRLQGNLGIKQKVIDYFDSALSVEESF